MSERNPQVTAYVLGSVDFGESDRILTLFTDGLGKISARARGARKSAKRYAGALSLFVQMDAVLERGRGDFWYIKESSAQRVYSEFGAHLGRYNAAVHFIEFIRAIIPEHEPDRRMFNCFESALARLASCDQREILAALFGHQLRALTDAGCGLTFDRCNLCRTLVPPGKPVFVAYEKGGVVCSPCGGGSIRLAAKSAAALIALGRFAGPAESGLEPDEGALDNVALDDEAAHDLYGLITHFAEHTFGCRIKTSPLSLGAPARTY